MAKQKNNIAKLSNSFSTGGGGGSFERRIQAVFLLALLVDGVSPILNMPVERVAFQARQLGDAVDDMVVFSTSGAKLLCQMKHSLSVTEKDATFQEVMRAAWHDFCAANCNIKLSISSVRISLETARCGLGEEGAVGDRRGQAERAGQAAKILSISASKASSGVL